MAVTITKNSIQVGEGDLVGIFKVNKCRTQNGLVYMEFNDTDTIAFPGEGVTIEGEEQEGTLKEVAAAIIDLFSTEPEV